MSIHRVLQCIPSKMRSATCELRAVLRAQLQRRLRNLTRWSGTAPRWDAAMREAKGEWWWVNDGRMKYCQKIDCNTAVKLRHAARSLVEWASDANTLSW